MGASRAGENGSSSGEQRGIQPRYRRAFGCVTWVYMATLAFLAAVSLLLMPVWFVEGWNVFSVLEGIAFFATLLILPGMALAAILGARTYRSERRPAARNGSVMGALVGWTGFTFLVWLEGIAPGGSGPSVVYWLVVPAVLVAVGLVVYALFANGPHDRRRRMVLIAALLVTVSGVTLLVMDFEPLQALIALISTVAGAAGGWTAGIGYARAGGDEMLPPGATIRRREPRRKSR